MSVVVRQITDERARAGLGEGCCWWPGQGLLWVDIHAGVVFLHPTDGAVRRWQLPEKVSAAIPTASGHILLPGVGRVLDLDPATGAVEVLVDLPGEPTGNRCNDAKCDPLGNLWVGTMDDAEERDSGALWCLTHGGSLVRLVSDVGVPNTLAWDERRHRMYFADSRKGTIFVFDWEAVDGVPTLGRGEVFLAPDDAPGVPDGSTIDAQGHLLNARWDGACVVRIGPDGKVVQRIAVPASRVTSCCFGGEGLSTLFITSAHDPQAAASDLGGHVFAGSVDVEGATGQAPTLWMGEGALSASLIDLSQPLGAN